MTEKELRKLCVEWQKVLRLQDWIVELEFKRERDMVNKGSAGECSFNTQMKRATIKLMDPVDYDERKYYLREMEDDLVHELLHLHFSPFGEEEDSPRDIAQEQAINCITSGLLTLKRRGKRG